jgi:hypothetical protein
VRIWRLYITRRIYINSSTVQWLGPTYTYTLYPVWKIEDRNNL